MTCPSKPVPPVNYKIEASFTSSRDSQLSVQDVAQHYAMRRPVSVRDSQLSVQDVAQHYAMRRPVSVRVRYFLSKFKSFVRCVTFFGGEQSSPPDPP